MLVAVPATFDRMHEAPSPPRFQKGAARVPFGAVGGTVPRITSVPKLPGAHQRRTVTSSPVAAVTLQTPAVPQSVATLHGAPTPADPAVQTPLKYDTPRTFDGGLLRSPKKALPSASEYGPTSMLAPTKLVQVKSELQRSRALYEVLASGASR